MRMRFRAPSPALIISLIALFVALGGTTYAATSLPKNSVGTKQLQKNAVTGPKIKKGAVTAAKINTKGLIVLNALHATTADSATNATTATNASNAAHAASATSAGDSNTVGGEAVKKFFFTSASATTPFQTLAQFATFTLQARCNGGLPDLELTSSVAEWGLGGGLLADGPTPTMEDLGSDNQPAGTYHLLDHGGQTGGGYITATTPDGHVVSIIYQLDSNATLGSNECLESGTMIGS